MCCSSFFAVGLMYLCLIFFFFFKQKTAYEMRISDWSSDVCSSDLQHVAFSAGPSSDYLVTLMAPCSGLVSAQTIGFSVTVGQLTHFDKLVVHDMGFTDQDRKSTRLNSSH